MSFKFPFTRKEAEFIVEKCQTAISNNDVWEEDAKDLESALDELDECIEKSKKNHRNSFSLSEKKYYYAVMHVYGLAVAGVYASDWERGLHKRLRDGWMDIVG